MKFPDTRVIVFNVAAGVVTIAALAAVVRSLVYTPALAPCTERYPSGTIFALERGGVLLDLRRPAGAPQRQGRRTRRQRRDRPASRVRPAPVVMGVTLAKGSISPHARHETKGGVSFPWQPRAVHGKTAACLAYSVLLPAGFDFHRVGCSPASAAPRAPTDPATKTLPHFSPGVATAASVLPPSSIRAPGRSN